MQRRSRRPAARLSCRRREFTPERLAAILRDALAAPAKLEAAAAAAKSVGVPDAAERLADLVLEIARPA